MAEQELVLTEGSSLQKNDQSDQSKERELLERELEPQERLFCYRYLESYNAKAAAESVGRASTNAHLILRKPKIARYIRLLSDELAEDSLITRDRVQFEILNEFLPRAKGEMPISLVDRDGAQHTAKVTNMAAYGKVLEMMSKHSGFTLPETVSGGLTIKIDHEAFGITVESTCEEIGNE